MMRMRRRSGVVTVVLLSLSTALAGCLNTGSEPPMAANGYGYPSIQRTTTYPGAPNGVPAGSLSLNASGSGLQQTSYAPPQATLGQAQIGRASCRERV